MGFHWPSKKTFIRFLISLVAIAAVLFIVLNLNQLQSRNSGSYEVKSAKEEYREMNSIKMNGKSYVKKDNISSFLLIGLDESGIAESSYSYNNDADADFLLLLVFDKEEKTLKMLEIDRDTMMEVQQYSITGVPYAKSEMQIALSHTYGDGLMTSAGYTANAVSELLLGSPVDYYISLRVDGLPKLVDFVGGVEVDFTEDYSDVNPKYKQGTTVTLSAEDAEHFIRDRKTVEENPTNAYRMERQKVFINAFINKLKKLKVTESYFVSLYNAIEQYAVSSMDIKVVSDLFSDLNKYSIQPVEILDGEYDESSEYMEFYPYKESIESVVLELFYEK